MSERNQEGYQSLGWIINKSECGLYIAVAEEAIQREIVEVYRRGAVGVYDYRRNPGQYSFQVLQQWIAQRPELQTFLIVNFQFAIRSEEDLKRLNFSRDMLAGLEKNLIFLTTAYGDDQLAGSAYDFYSFVKMRILFHTDREDQQWADLLPSNTENQSIERETLNPEKSKQMLEESRRLLEQAQEAGDKAEYQHSERLLLKAKEIREKLLGAEHLEMTEIYLKLSEIYERLGKYREAENYCLQMLKISEEILGEEHPDTVDGYNQLAVICERQGKYQEAENLSKKALNISEKIFGENHPCTAVSYNNLGVIYVDQGKYQEAEQLYKRVLNISEKIFGEEHANISTVYNNLAPLYNYYK